MAPRLILNADDFGLTYGINRAISELHVAGALTSATLMVNGPAFEDAITIAKMSPGLGVGCHVVLTDGTPVLHPDKIPSLMGADGKTFRSSLVDFFKAVLLRKVSEEDIAREALAQIQKLQKAGINVTHLDTHKHTHVLPGIARPLLVAAERAGIGAVRNPFEEPWSMVIGRSSFMRQLQVRLINYLRPRFEALPQIRTGTIQTTKGTIGISATGRLDAKALQAILSALPEGIWEVVCHPGYNDRDLQAVNTRLRDSRNAERIALLAAFGDLSAHPSHPELIHYGSDMQWTFQMGTNRQSDSTGSW